MKFSFMKEITELNKYGDPDMSDEALDFYNEYFPWIKEQGMRGDTICSFGASFGAGNKDTNKNLEILIDGNVWKRSYTQVLFNGDEKYEILEYRKRYHSLSNFWVIPAILNSWRGKDDRSGNLPAQADFIDVFLDCVRNYYLGYKNPESVIDIFSRDSVVKWFTVFGNGENGWRSFVDRNYINPFVNKDTYVVKDILDENFCSEIASDFGTFHEYGKPLHQHAKGILPEKSAMNFVRNSLWAMEERTKILMKQQEI